VVAAILVAALGVSGCGQDGDLADAPRWTGSMEERDGATWVTNPADPLWPSDGSPRIEFELEQVFGADEAPEEAMLAGIRSIAVDDVGRVYVLDQGDNRLVAFAASGDFLWSDGSLGEGPGDIERPRGVVWNGADFLYVANQSGARIDTWSTDGVFLDSALLADFGLPGVWKLGFNPPSTMVLLPFSRAVTEGHTLSTEGDWEVVDSFTMAPLPDVEQPGRTGVGADSRVAENSIVFGSPFDYEFRLFHLDGRPDRVVVRPNTGFVPAAIDLERGSVGSMGNLDAPVRLADGRWLAHAYWPANISDPIAFTRRRTAGERVRFEWRHAVDVFDDEGRWLTGRRWEYPDWPPFGTIMMIGPDGSLYTSASDPFPQVRRYRVTLRPPGSSE